MGKGVKVTDNQKKGGKRHRSTQVDMCIKYTRERSKLYRERKKLKISIESGGLEGKSLAKSMEKLAVLNYKVEGYKSKLFKCGKKYAKLKSKKRKLVSRKNYLLKILKDVPAGSKEYKKDYDELMRVTAKIDDMEYAMKHPLTGFKDGEFQVGAIHTPSLLDVDTIGFWNLGTLISDTLASAKFKTITLDGKKYDLIKDVFFIQDRVKTIIREITEARVNGRMTGTPLIVVESNFTTLDINITTGLENE